MSTGIFDQSELKTIQLLEQDIDIDRFKLILAGVIGLGAVDAITSATVTRTTEQASTLTVSVVDYDRYLLRSGYIQQHMDVNIDGLWWRLAQVAKNGDIIDLIFEEREVGILRLYTKKKVVSRSQMTRAEFILSLIKEVTEVVIPYYIPELHKKQPLEADTSGKTDPNLAAVINNKVAASNKAVNKDEKGMTVKGAKATESQISNANAILQIGDASIPDSNPHKRKILVVAMMVAITENSITSYPYRGDSVPAGVFQQIRSTGWPGTDIVQIDADAFFNYTMAKNHKSGIIEMDKLHPNASYNDLAQLVQASAYPNNWGPHQAEAEKWVSAFGIPGDTKAKGDSKGDKSGSAAGNNSSGGTFQDILNSLGITDSSSLTNLSVPSSDYLFTRGTPPTNGRSGWLHESSWVCIQRLAKEVNWKAFFVSGTFYYMSEDYMFKTMPRAVLSEDSDGINSIDGDHDDNKKTGTCSISCQMGRYDAVPGTVIKLFDMGPWNGRWLVSEIERDIFMPTGTITLKKPDPKYLTLEPLTNSFGGSISDPNNPLAPKDTTGSTGTLPGNLPKELKPCCETIIKASATGQYTDDNGSQMGQWRKAGAGEKLDSRCGYKVDLDPRVPCFIASLLDMGYSIGTYAICEDHDCKTDDGNISAHSQGRAVDITSIGKGAGKLVVNTRNNNYIKQLTIDVMELAIKFGASQVICNGNDQYDQDVRNHQWDGGAYHPDTITGDHTNHVHVGF